MQGVTHGGECQARGRCAGGPAAGPGWGGWEGTDLRGAALPGARISDAAPARTGVPPPWDWWLFLLHPGGVACAPLGVFWGVTKPGAAQSGVSLLW